MAWKRKSKKKKLWKEDFALARFLLTSLCVQRFYHQTNLKISPSRIHFKNIKAGTRVMRGDAFTFQKNKRITSIDIFIKWDFPEIFRTPYVENVHFSNSKPLYRYPSTIYIVHDSIHLLWTGSHLVIRIWANYYHVMPWSRPRPRSSWDCSVSTRQPLQGPTWRPSFRNRSGPVGRAVRSRAGTCWPSYELTSWRIRNPLSRE